MIRTIAISILLPLLFIFPVKAYPKPEIKVQVEVKGSSDEIVRLVNLSSVTQKVVNDPEFESRLLGASFRKGQAFAYSNETAAQVFQTLVDGSELGSAKDNIWQMKFVFQAKKRNCFLGRCGAWVLGWTDPSIKEIYINSIPWPTRDDCGIVGTIVHENSHKLGYSHPFQATSIRSYSVPYIVGTIASEICQKKFAPAKTRYGI